MNNNNTHNKKRNKAIMTDINANLNDVHKPIYLYI